MKASAFILLFISAPAMGTHAEIARALKIMHGYKKCIDAHCLRVEDDKKQLCTNAKITLQHCCENLKEIEKTQSKNPDIVYIHKLVDTAKRVKEEVVPTLMAQEPVRE